MSGLKSGARVIYWPGVKQARPWSVSLKLGEHFICELSGCDRELLFDNSRIRSVFMRAAQESGLSVVGEGCFEFSPHGFTSYLLLQESHASIHVWPEYQYCAVDLFTCNLKVDSEPFFDALRQLLGAKYLSLQMIERGIAGEAIA